MAGAGIATQNGVSHKAESRVIVASSPARARLSTGRRRGGISLQQMPSGTRPNSVAPSKDGRMPTPTTELRGRQSQNGLPRPGVGETATAVETTAVAIPMAAIPTVVIPVADIRAADIRVADIRVAVIPAVLIVVIAD
jgi:hypothetical protein